MNQPNDRRGFVKQGVALGGALLLRPVGAVAAEASKTPSNETLTTIHALHSTHGNFTKRDIPDDKIEEILQASVRTANASNMQSYSIIVVRDRGKIKDVCGYEGSCLLVYCVDYNRLEASAASLGHPYFPDNMTAFITGSISTAIAAQTAVIAAQSLGIDSLLTNGVHRGDMQRHFKLLGIPEKHCVPLIALVLGYATSQPQFEKGRLTGTGVIHRDTYHRLTKAEVEEITARYDDPEAHLGLISGWTGQGYKHYLDWLFTEWQGRATTPSTSDTPLFQFVKRAGFVEPHNS